MRPLFDQVSAEVMDVALFFSNLRERGLWATMKPRQRLQDLFVQAAFQSWPKLWRNLRASAQTDLANRFPAHVVCEWLGNSEAVAKEH